MNVNDIISRLEKAGFKQSKALGTTCNINVEGGFICGVYNGPVTFKDESGDVRTSHKFTVEKDGDGSALIGRDATKPETLKAGEYTVFGSGLLNAILADGRTGKRVSIVYNGKKPFTFTNDKGKPQTVKSHQYICLDGEPVAAK